MELNDFLTTYKELEQILRNKEKQIGDGTVLAYENTLDQDNLEKLKTCRIIRNYCQHHSDYTKFISIDGMVNFLNRQINELEKQESLVKDIMNKTKAPTLKDNFEELVRYFAKAKVNWCPIINDKPKKNESCVVGVVTQEQLITLILTTKLNTKISKIITKQMEKELKNYSLIDSKKQANKLTNNKNYIIVDNNIFKGIIDNSALF